MAQFVPELLLSFSFFLFHSPADVFIELMIMNKEEERILLLNISSAYRLQLGEKRVHFNKFLTTVNHASKRFYFEFSSFCSDSALGYLHIHIAYYYGSFTINIQLFKVGRFFLNHSARCLYPNKRSPR